MTGDDQYLMKFKNKLKEVNNEFVPLVEESHVTSKYELRHRECELEVDCNSKKNVQKAESFWGESEA